MVTVECTNDEWPMYEAYSLSRGFLFHLFCADGEKLIAEKMAKMCKYIGFGHVIKKNCAGW